ncbi:MAG: putative glycolipid-binding domain-containing protein [Thermomicrobiales bacterium]
MGERTTIRDYLWQPWARAGSEHLRLWPSAQGGDIQADSQLVVAADDGEHLLRGSYRVVLDAAWRVRSVRVACEQEDGTALGIALQSDRAGRWRDGSGTDLPELDGCIDIDIAATPFTNTLPIRRLQPVEGQSVEIRVAYVAIPTLDLSAMTQRYTRLDAGTVRYESLRDGAVVFARDLAVDADGIVVMYPALFRRTWPG